MIPTALLLGAASAAVISTLTPGPAFLSLLGIGALQGRRVAFWFILGHLAGDVMWSLLAMVAVIGSQVLGAVVFELLGLACAAYLFRLGFGAVRARNAGAASPLAVHRPLRRGIIFGVTNPKGYPVAIALFTTFLGGHGALRWDMVPALEAAAIAGFLAADLVVVALVGAGWARRVFLAHETLVTRLAGLVFIGFALETAWDSLGGLLRRVAAPG